MKLKELSIIALLHFACTLVLGFVVSYFYPQAIEMSSLFWVALGVAVGKLGTEIIKNKFFNKKAVQVKS